MQTFHTQFEPDFSWRVRQLLRPALLFLFLLLTWIFNSVEPFDARRPENWIFPALAFIVWLVLISFMLPRNIREISLNADNRTITLDTVHPLWGKKIFTLAFHQIAVKLIDFKGNWLLDPEHSVVFYRNRISWLKLSDRKDGFTRSDLEMILNRLKELTCGG